MKKTKPIEWTEDEKGCFICTSHSLVGDGYPHIRRSYKNIRISRLVYQECFGDLNDELVIRHTCDNKLCVNPEHLLAGTHQDNAQDRVDRGLSRKGETNGSARLTDSDVKRIKYELIPSGQTLTSIAKIFGVSLSTISMIHHGKSWPHI